MNCTFRFREIAMTIIAPVVLCSSSPPVHAQGPGPAPGCQSAPNTSEPVSCANGDVIIPDKEIFITSTCVVDDACRTTWNNACEDQLRGAWTFGKLMASLAGFETIDEDPIALSNFVEDWLFLFADAQTVNGFDVKPRDNILTLIEKWKAISEMSGSEGLDMTLAPFRLLAIVNRMDLRQAPGPYGGGNAGEGRFVFVFLNIDLTNPFNPQSWPTLAATVIFEYQLPAQTCQDVLDWAALWHSLGNCASSIWCRQTARIRRNSSSDR